MGDLEAQAMPGPEGISFHYYCPPTDGMQHHIQPGIACDLSPSTYPTIKTGSLLTPKRLQISKPIAQWPDIMS
jgi:hypothetical protein